MAVAEVRWVYITANLRGFLNVFSSFFPSSQGVLLINRPNHTYIYNVFRFSEGYMHTQLILSYRLLLSLAGLRMITYSATLGAHGTEACPMTHPRMILPPISCSCPTRLGTSW